MMKSLFFIALFCSCFIEFSHQRYLLSRNDDVSIENDNGRVIVKRDLGDDFFDTIIEKGKSFFSDDDESNNDNKPASVSSVNHDSANDRLTDNKNERTSTIDRTSSSSSDGTSNAETSSHTRVTSTKSDDDSDSLIDEKTFKTILQKVISFASSSDSDNENQGNDNTHNTESGKGSSDSDTDDLTDKLGNILIREGIKIGIAELASSFLGKK
uniref:Uncharacterized protein n=1 Tax=Panagrolaimus superbus TaxID=310955 RepID=A0A914YYQ8_9BILA